MKQPNYAGYSIWALDFIRALNQRPAWIKFLLRLVFGKYAYREFVGMVNAFDEDGWYSPFMWYGLEDVDYNKETKNWRWWKDEK